MRTLVTPDHYCKDVATGEDQYRSDGKGELAVGHSLKTGKPCWKSVGDSSKNIPKILILNDAFFLDPKNEQDYGNLNRLLIIHALIADDFKVYYKDENHFEQFRNHDALTDFYFSKKKP